MKQRQTIHVTTELQDKIAMELDRCEDEKPTPENWARVKALEWVLEQAGCPRRS